MSFSKTYLPILLPALLITLAGLLTMNTYGVSGDFFDRQVWWLLISLVAFFAVSFYDHRPLRRSGVVVTLFVAITLVLGLLFVVGSVFQGAQSWFNLGAFAVQPADPAKLVLILILAKFFSRRHTEIASFKQLAISFGYMLVIAILLFLQPDFGSAMIIALIWLGMVVVSGIPLSRLATIFGVGIIALASLWTFALADYQKARVTTFLDPFSDITGSGYNVYQSLVAVSAGGFWGRGLGEGTQSRLAFLPESETDFILAAFVEEWGTFGAIILFSLFGYLIYQIVKRARVAETNFETLTMLGVTVLILSHFLMHVAINMALLPATGITLSLMSYGGSHLITEYIALGLVVSMSRRQRLRYGDESVLMS